MSGDEDCLPIVDAVKNTGKRVYGAFFESHISRELNRTFDASIVLDREWFVKHALKGKVMIREFSVKEISVETKIIQISSNLAISVLKATMEFLIINPDGVEYETCLCSLAKYDTGTCRIEDLTFSVLPPKNVLVGKCRTILLIKEDKRMIAYREGELDSDRNIFRVISSFKGNDIYS